MKEIIRKILNEEIKNNLHEGRPLSSKNKFAKEWLSRYNNLKKYKSGDGRFIYLADDNGKIMVSLDTQINETAVEWERIWSLLDKVFGEKESRRRIIGWLLDRYGLPNMGYVYDETLDMMGSIDDSDIPVDQETIKEDISNKSRQILIDRIKSVGFIKTSKTVGGDKNLMKMLKIDSPMDFLHLFDDLEQVQSKKEKDWTLFRYKPNENLMIYDRKNGYVYINYYEIWSVLGDNFGLDHSETQQLTQEWLDEVYNLKGVTTKTTKFKRKECWMRSTI